MSGTRLAGKVVVITGASSGIGEAIARRFASEGATLVLAARSVDKLSALEGELVAEGGSATSMRCDVRSKPVFMLSPVRQRRTSGA